MRVTTASEFGKLVRKTRKNAKLTQASLAAASGIGERFVRELEKGKPTCQLEKALFVAQMLGIKFNVTVPPTKEE
jgi:HTH-type transcriptional regulator/antitoxin HipB